jgi:hypothetical protein
VQEEAQKNLKGYVEGNGKDGRWNLLMREEEEWTTKYPADATRWMLLA